MSVKQILYFSCTLGFWQSESSWKKARKKPRPERSPVGATFGNSVTVPVGEWNKPIQKSHVCGSTQAHGESLGDREAEVLLITRLDAVAVALLSLDLCEAHVLRVRVSY